jgi:hypothetical protein
MPWARANNYRFGGSADEQADGQHRKLGQDRFNQQTNKRHQHMLFSRWNFSITNYSYFAIAV